MRGVIHFLLIVLSCQICTLKAQQIPQYSQYVFNNFMINPAVAGSKECMDIKLGYRSQWVGFQDAPQTMFISMHKRVFSRNQFSSKSAYEGVGGYLIKDQVGPIGKIGGHVAYSVHISLNTYLKLAMGISIGALQHSINTNLLTPVNLPDPAVSSKSALVPDANAGLWLYHENFFTGIAIRQLIPFKIGGSNNLLQNHFLLSGGYKMRFTSTISLIPSAHIKIVANAPIQIDANLKADWKNTVWVAVTYRKIDGMAGIIGVKANHLLHIAYAYDYNTSSIQNYSSNGHEIIIGITPNCKEKGKYDCPTFN